MAADQKGLKSTFQHLYTDELPAFIDSLKSIENLPDSLRDSIATVEQNIEQNKKLIEPLVSGSILDMLGSVDVEGIAGGILGALAKKKHMKKLSGKKLIAIQDNATHFSDTIVRIKQLIGSSGNTKPDYEHLTAQEKKELLVLAEEMKTLSGKLTEQLAA